MDNYRYCKLIMFSLSLACCAVLLSFVLNLCAFKIFTDNVKNDIINIIQTTYCDDESHTD